MYMYYRFACVFVIFVSRLSSAVGEKVSDACHGLNNVRKADNTMECEIGLTVFVIKVRYYQSKLIPECPFELSTDANIEPSCCVHESNTCSWISKTETTQFQQECKGNRICTLHSTKASHKGLNCTPHHFSSVRSIIYECVKNESPSVRTTERPTYNPKPSYRFPNTTQSMTGENDSNEDQNESTTVRTTPNTTQSMTGENDSNKDQNDVWKIVGPVIGVLVVLVILAVVFFIRRAKSKQKIPGVHSANEQIPERNQKNTPSAAISKLPRVASGHDSEANVEISSTGDDISVQYATLNSPRTRKGDYDEPQNFMPSATFQSTAEYSHIIGEQETYNGVYDTADTLANQQTSNSEPEYQVVNPTYDKLSKENIRVNSVKNVDHYNVLEKRTI